METTQICGKDNKKIKITPDQFLEIVGKDFKLSDHQKRMFKMIIKHGDRAIINQPSTLGKTMMDKLLREYAKKNNEITGEKE